MSSKDKKKQACFDKTFWEHEDFLQWVAEVKSEPTKYRCKICFKTNGLSNMGIDALKIHLTNSAVSEAKLCWTLKFVIAGYSNSSNADCNCLFLSMFPDSNIA